MASKISKKGIPPMSKLPVKTEVNFAHIGETKINWIIAVPAIIAIIIGACLLSKIAVIDRFAKLHEMQSKAHQMERQQEEYYDTIQSYGDLNVEYAHYAYDGFTDEELALEDRGKVFNLIEEKVLAKADTTSWSLSGNVLSMTVTGVTLEEISKMVADIESMDIVSYCMVSKAQTNGTAWDEEISVNQPVTASMTVFLKGIVFEEDEEFITEFEGEVGGELE